MLALVIAINALNFIVCFGLHAIDRTLEDIRDELREMRGGQDADG